MLTTIDLCTLARIAAADGNYRAATELMEQAISAYPGYPSSLLSSLGKKDIDRLREVRKGYLAKWVIELQERSSVRIADPLIVRTAPLRAISKEEAEARMKALKAQAEARRARNLRHE